MEPLLGRDRNRNRPSLRAKIASLGACDPGHILRVAWTGRMVLSKGLIDSPLGGEASMAVIHSHAHADRITHDFSRNPMLVYWEMTQACGLACRHCRASAVPCAHPLELSTAEMKGCIAQLLAFGDPPPD